jgi:hypothetical protein
MVIPGTVAQRMAETVAVAPITIHQQRRHMDLLQSQYFLVQAEPEEVAKRRAEPEEEKFVWM